MTAIAFGGPGPRPTSERRTKSSRRRRGRVSRRRFSSLTLRILAPNVLALGILVGGVLFLDQYRDGLIEAKVAALQTEAEIIAGAVGESALVGAPESPEIDQAMAARMIRRLVVPGDTRARLFDAEGRLIADSRTLAAAGRDVQLKYLPPLDVGKLFTAFFERVYDWILPRLPESESFPVYRERPEQRAQDYAEARGALRGEVGGAVRQGDDGSLVLSVAVPVQELHRVFGALMLTSDSADIEASVREVRLGIIEVFALSLLITVLLSVFLAGTIARPVRRLAHAADRVRRWRGQRVEIPDLSQRRDEIGDLSAALREMTLVLYARVDAIDAFAADVAHEIRNPLTSLRSAVEAVDVAQNESQRVRLLQVIKQDVSRLDRLISDISNASRLDAELSRAESEPVDLAALLTAAAEVYRARTQSGGPRFELDLPDEAGPVIEGLAGRLGQVVDNLAANAVSFSPPDGVIRLGLARDDGFARLTVEDDGPGLPEDWIERLFERFYSARPDSEDFGHHSGLGLSIARQIVEAHGGTISGENRRDPAGRVLGARFVVRLPY